MIASEAERGQIPLAAKYLSKKRFGYLDDLVHKSRLATAVLAPCTQEDVEQRLKAMVVAEPAPRAARPGHDSIFQPHDVPVPQGETEVLSHPGVAEERGLPQLTTH